MAQDMPEVEAATSISPWYGSGLNLQTIKVKNEKNDILFEEPDFFFADSTFFDVFDLEIIAGDREVLTKSWQLIITEEMAFKYFGDEDPIGQELLADNNPLIVGAVVKGLPKNAHFHFRGILSYVSLKNINPNNPWFKWEDFGHFNYIKTKPNTDFKALEAKIPEWVAPYLDWSIEDLKSLKDGVNKFALQPIADIHLYSHIRWELENNGNILYIYILMGTFIFLLLIVAINYVNLTTAKSLDRAKEIGVRKTLGAMSGKLKIQFYLESLLFCLVSLFLALGLAILLLDSFSHITNKTFLVDDLINLGFLTKASLTCLVIAFIAGLYPAIVMTAFEPSEVLKGQFSRNSQGNGLRSILVVMQFIVSAILITGSIVILKQLDFMKTKDLGFDQEAVISIKIHYKVELGGLDMVQLHELQTQFLTVPGVKNTSAISNLPGDQFDQNPLYLKSDPGNRIDVSELYLDFNAEQVLNFEMVEGRIFDKSHASDLDGSSFIVNESLVAQLNLDNPLGESLILETTWAKLEGNIVGVVKDFNYKSLHENIQPLFIRIDPQGINHLIVKLEGQNFQQTLAEMKTVYESLEEEVPFEYHFLDQKLADLYNTETRTLNIFSIFTVIALVLACLGLLGMAIAMLNQRVKEVGIRKIMGASSSGIIQMVLLQFSKLIGTALIIGIPIGYFLIQQWMNEFSYKVEIGFMPFIIASGILFLVAIASVSAVVMKIAYTNPADTLRYE
jgi:putative ABC transport system permease protein